MTDQGGLLQTRDLTKNFAARRILRRRAEDDILAVDGISLSVQRGHTLGIVGESGSGKTTLARMIAGLTPVTSGQVLLDGQDTATISDAQIHRQIQYVFQDPYSALNPRRTIRWSLDVPLRFLRGMSRTARRETISSLLEQIGLRPEMADRYPHELSGGQRQRVVIARAIASDPSILVLDEPVSALDVSIQAQILILLRELQSDLTLTYLFISHDLAVVESLADDVLVMRNGVVVERGSRSGLFTNPQHDYTKKLLAGVPGTEPKRASRTTVPTPEGNTL